MDESVLPVRLGGQEAATDRHLLVGLQAGVMDLGAVRGADNPMRGPFHMAFTI